MALDLSLVHDSIYSDEGIEFDTYDLQSSPDECNANQSSQYEPSLRIDPVHKYKYLYLIDHGRSQRGTSAPYARLSCHNPSDIRPY